MIIIIIEGVVVVVVVVQYYISLAHYYVEPFSLCDTESQGIKLTLTLKVAIFNIDSLQEAKITLISILIELKT